MNKASMGALIAAKHGLSAAEGNRVVGTIFAAIKASLAAEGTFSYYGFGRLRVIERAARQGRDPNTGLPITISKRLSIKFSPSPTLTDEITKSRGR